MYNMGSWQKTFVDGTVEDGEDRRIAHGDASWSKGRLDDIVEVNLFEGTIFCSLAVPDTIWHQFDRFIVPASEGTHISVRIYIAVQAEIRDHHVGKYVVCKHESHFLCAIVDSCTQPETEYSYNRQITKAHVGKWVTVVLPKEGSPFMRFSIRGKINDN